MSEHHALLVLTSTFPRWKSDQEPPFVYELSRRLTEQWQVTVLAPHAEHAAIREEMDGLQIYRFRYFLTPLQTLTYRGGILANLKQNKGRYLLIPFFLMGEAMSLYRLLKTQEFSLIHAHWIIPQGLIAVLVKKLLRKNIPIVCTSHGGDLYGLQQKWLQKLKIWILNQCQSITVVSQAMQETVLTMGVTTPVQVIPMGTDLENRFVPSTIDKELNSLLFVGRLVEKKGVSYLLEAFAKVLEKIPSAQLTIVGSGTQEHLLKQQAESLNIAPRVNFVGAVSHEQLAKFYQSTEIVVFPSIISADGDREGFGLVLVEALGCEAAVIATDLPAVHDIIQDQETAIIIPQKAVTLLAEKILLLFANPTLREQLGKKGRNFVLSHYHWKTVTENYHRLFVHVLTYCRK